MQTNLTTVPASRQQSITPEIAEALKTLRAADFRLEQTYFPFGDWESRLELAEELRDILDDLPTDELADMTAAVVRDLESEGEDFGDWPVRCDAAQRLRRVMRHLESDGEEVGADVF
jgi:hypothetical protein